MFGVRTQDLEHHLSWSLLNGCHLIALEGLLIFFLGYHCLHLRGHPSCRVLVGVHYSGQRTGTSLRVIRFCSTGHYLVWAFYYNVQLVVSLQRWEPYFLLIWQLLIDQINLGWFATLKYWYPCPRKVIKIFSGLYSLQISGEKEVLFVRQCIKWGQMLLMMW